MRNIIVLTILMFFFSNCENASTEKVKTAEKGSFVALASATSGIHFNNKITETDTLNYFVYPYLYLGAGVATGDFNNDGLADIFFTGNMVDNQLYQNLGNLQFKEISKTANVSSVATWTTGVTLIDINNDGWLDIYTCVSGRKANKRNQLFINNGNLTFTESAEKYGLADNSPSIQSVFFDYDKDGDLDCYVANYPVAPFGASNFYYLNKMRNLADVDSDHLYRNNGNGTFTDVSKESGIANYGLSLGISVADFDENGFDDIYISNDFATPDRFFFNNGNGTFTEQVKEATFQTSLFGMGCDAADFNNDGLFDLVQVDMTPKDNRRNKENMASMNPQVFEEMLYAGFHYQYMYNALQLNRGKVHADSIPKFSNMAQLGDMAKTDWSWSPLFADLDNDGWKDVFITNGIKREVNNRDFHNAMKMKINFTKDLKAAVNYEEIPSEPIANYAFRNTSKTKGLGFENVSESWNLDLKGFSHGSAFADFDNDGDLDLVINNVDSEAVVYNNQLSKNNYLRFKLKGDKYNVLGIGTKVEITNNKETQTQHLTLTRGYQSAVEPILHFGLGKAKTAEKIVITWSDGKVEILKNIKANQVITVNYAKAKIEEKETTVSKQIFSNATNFPKIKHFENNYDDYILEPLLPYQTSRLGGHISVADVNGDGLDDFFLGNAYGKSSVLYLQKANNQFEAITIPFEADKDFEAIGSLFFDADGDKDLDLYVVSGGNEFSRRPENLQDILYINNNGNFEKSDALPKITGSGGRVKAGDFDNDGDLDLFISGRLAPAKYPNPGISYILENTNGKFIDVTQTIAPELQNIGMVTDALWSDYDNDKDLDLIIVGEWLPITVFENNKNSFSNSFAISDEVGWFYSLATGDFDKDGDMDYVAGNLGENYKYHASEAEPFEVFAGDFDQNGKHDIVLSYYQNDKLFPLRGKQCSSEQIPVLEIKYKDYHSFATSELKDIYGTENLENALNYKATTFASLFIENKGKGEFETRKLPALAQISNIESCLVKDFDKDGNLDIIIAGNLYDAEIETPRNDASLGLFLKGNGKGNFQAIDTYKSGLLLSGNVKSLAFIGLGNGGNGILVGVNSGVVQCVNENIR